MPAEGFDIRVNLVGPAIDDETLKRDFREWAELEGGLYFDASSDVQVRAALERAVMPNFHVIDATGTVVAEGTAAGDPVTLALDPTR